MQCSSSVRDHADAEPQKMSQNRATGGPCLSTRVLLQGDGDARTPVTPENLAVRPRTSATGFPNYARAPRLSIPPQVGVNLSAAVAPANGNAKPVGPNLLSLLLFRRSMEA